MPDRMTGNHGLLVTPFDEDHEVDVESLRRLIDFAIDGGVEGLMPLGTTGEFFSLTADEKRRVVDVCVEQARGRVPVWVGVGYSGTRISVELAQYAASRGADGILVPPPYYYPLADTSMLVHFAAVAKAVSLDVMLYDGGGGVEIPVSTVEQLNREYPHVRHVKVSVLRAGKVAALRAALADVRVFCGDETMLMPALASGAVGMATASGIVLPRECTEICRSFRDGRPEDARRTYMRTLAPWTIASGITKSEFVRCFKEVLAARGVIRSPATRLPLGELSPSRRADLLATAGALGMLRA